MTTGASDTALFDALRDIVPTADFDDLAAISSLLLSGGSGIEAKREDESFSQYINRVADLVREQGFENPAILQAVYNVSPKLLEDVDPFLAIPPNQALDFGDFLADQVRSGVYTLEELEDLDPSEATNIVQVFEATQKTWARQVEDAALLDETPPSYLESLQSQKQMAQMDERKRIQEVTKRRQQVEQAAFAQDLERLARSAAQQVVGGTEDFDAEQLDQYEKLVNNIMVEMEQRIENQGLDRLQADDRNQLIEFGRAQAREFQEGLDTRALAERTERVQRGQELPPAPGGLESAASGPQAQELADRLASGGLTAQERALQAANLDEERDLLGDLASAVRGERDGDFIDFLLNERSNLETRFRASEQDKATELKRRASAPAFQGTNFGAGDLAPTSFTDFVQNEMDGLRERFDDARRKRINAPANRPTII